MLKTRESLGLSIATIPPLLPVAERKAYTEPLDQKLSAHLNIWMETLRGCITIDPSQTMTRKINDMMNTIHEEGLVKLSAHVLAHFLYDRGVNIEPADAARVEIAFRMILKDPSVKAILVNIFGGIVRCDRVAQGVVDAYKNIGDINVPIIVRLQGTNAEEAKKLIDDSGLEVHSAVVLQEAADLVKKLLATA